MAAHLTSQVTVYIKESERRVKALEEVESEIQSLCDLAQTLFISIGVAANGTMSEADMGKIRIPSDAPGEFKRRVKYLTGALEMSHRALSSSNQMADLVSGALGEASGRSAKPSPYGRDSARAPEFRQKDNRTSAKRSKEGRRGELRILGLRL